MHRLLHVHSSHEQFKTFMSDRGLNEKRQREVLQPEVQAVKAVQLLRCTEIVSLVETFKM